MSDQAEAPVFDATGELRRSPFRALVRWWVIWEGWRQGASLFRKESVQWHLHSCNEPSLRCCARG